jgi:hypothetical protein
MLLVCLWQLQRKAGARWVKARLESAIGSKEPARHQLAPDRPGLIPSQRFLLVIHNRRNPRKGLHGNLAEGLRGSSPDAAFSFLSGNGADPTGKSRMAFARYKGEAEKALLAARFPRVYIFRPAYIYPVEPRKEPNFSYRLLRSVYPVFRVLFPNQVIRADDLARAMVNVVLGSDSRPSVIFENKDIRAVAASFVLRSTM